MTEPVPKAISRLPHQLKIPKTPSPSLASRISQLRGQNLSPEEISEKIITTWVEHFTKIDVFWAELQKEVDKVFEERTSQLSKREIDLYDWEEKLWEREQKINDAEHSKHTNEVFTSLDDLINRGVTPDLAVGLVRDVFLKPRHSD